MKNIIPSSLLMIVMFILKFAKGQYVPKWSCDFEDGLCDWYKADVNGVGWEHSADSQYRIKDHTKDSINGSVAVLELTGVRFGDAGKLVSPLFRPANGSCKMVFFYKVIRDIDYYYLYLKVEKVIKKMDGISRVRLFRSLIRDHYWKRGEVTLNSDVDFQVEIIGSSHYVDGIIALDDVMFTEGCFTQELTPIKIVKPQSLPKYNFPEGVFYEKTGNSWSIVCDKDKAIAACRYLGCNGLANSTLVARGFESGQKICLSSNNTLSNSSSCHNTTGCVNATFWRCKSDYVMTCPRLTHNTCTSGTGSLKCYDDNQRCDFHKDCPGGEDEEDCIEYKRCDFQNDFCNWMPSKHTNLEWQRTKTREGNRYYLKADNSHSSNKNDQGKLLLKDTIEGSPNVTCVLRFSYQTSRYWTGMFRIFSLTRNTERVIHSISTSHRQGWLRQNLILRTRGNFRIRIDVRGPSYHGFFNLANISFSPECLFRNHTHVPSNRSDIFVCHSGEDISSALVCNLNVDCFDGSDELNCKNHSETCTFENSLCSWRIEENAATLLRRHRGRTPSTGVGPSKDHTNKFISGYYIYLEASGIDPGHSGYLISGLMQRSLSGICTGYYYEKGKLEVMYYDPMSRIEKILWTKEGNQGRSWRYGSVTFNVASLFYRIKLKFTRGDSYRSDIAVDDVSFSDECYNIQNYNALAIKQVCNTGQVMYKIGNRSASIFYEYNTKLGSHLRCQWLITADPRLRIHLSAEYFYTAYSDKVLIRHDHSSTISGTRAPFHLVSPSNILRIEFNATHMNTSQGFAFNISSTDAQMHSAKPYHIPSGSGTIELILKCRNQVQTSKLVRNFATIKPRLRFSSGTYFNDEDCVYKFHATNGYRMRFNFRFFKTENGPDYVEVLNSGIIGKGLFSGDLDPFYFVSKGSWLSFRFKTDSAHVKRGFILQVSLTASPAIGVTTDRKTSTTALPRTIPVSVQPYQFLTQKCHRPARMLWFGDKFFGSLRPHGALLRYRSIYCTWTVPTKADFKYVIEITHEYLDHVISSLKITDETHTSARTLSTFTQARNWENLVVVSDGQFTVKSTLRAYSMNVSVISYSIYPGCYPNSLEHEYDFKYTSGQTKAQCIYECKTSNYKYVFVVNHNNYGCYCGNTEPSRKGFDMVHPRFCSSPPLYRDCTGGICLRGGFGRLYMTAPDALNATTPAKKVSAGNLSAELIASSFGILAFLVFTFIFIRYRIRKRQRVERYNRGADQSLPVQTPDVRYVPDSALGDAPPSYSDATKEGVFFMSSSNAGAFSLTNDPPPSFEEAISGAANAGALPPKYDTIQYSSPLSMETPSGVGAHLNQTPLLTNLSQLSSPRVAFPAVDDGDSRPSSAALARSRPASAASVDSVSDSLNPLVRPTSRQHLNPNRMLPPLQVRVRATDNRSPGIDV